MFHESTSCSFYCEKFSIKNSFSRFVESTSYSTHIHNGYEIIYLLGGSITYGFEGREIKLSKGDVLITPPYKYHYLNVDNNINYERINILFYPEKFGFELNLNDIVIYNDSNHIIYKILNNIKFYCDYAKEEDRGFIFELKIKELIYALVNDFSSGTKLDLVTYDKTMRNILDFINQNIYKNITVEDIAKDCFLSEGHIHHVFRKELKTSPVNYIKMKNLAVAQKLLSFGTTPTEVSQKLGYEDYSVFYRNYVKYFNKKPSDDYKK